MNLDFNQNFYRIDISLVQYGFTVSAQIVSTEH